MAINVSKRYNILQFEDSIIIDFESKLSVDIDVLDVIDVFIFFLNVVNLCLCSLSARIFIINTNVTCTKKVQLFSFFSWRL